MARLHLCALFLASVSSASSELILPRLPMQIATEWPAPNGSVYWGDLRAVMFSNETFDGTTNLTAQVYWRLRPPAEDNPNEWTQVLAHDADGSAVRASASVLTGTCGIVHLTVESTHSSPFYIYARPYVQSGGGAGLHFQWLAGDRPSRDEARCALVLNTTARTVRLETRTEFHGFDDMESFASPDEVVQLARLASPSAPILAFMEPHDRAVRAFDASVPADWAASGPRTNLTLAAPSGAFVSFQAGLLNAAGTSPVSVRAVTFSDLVAAGDPALPALPASKARCFSTGGVDSGGVPFSKDYSLQPGHVGSLWMGLDSTNATPGALYAGTISLELVVGDGGGATTLELSLALAVDPGAPVDDHGDANITASFARLRWLDSDVGIDEEVTSPFDPVRAHIATDGLLRVACTGKELVVGANGLPSKVTTNFTTRRRGSDITTAYDLLEQPLELVVVDGGGADVVLDTTSPLAVTENTYSHVSWVANWSSPSLGIHAIVRGRCDYDSYVKMSVGLVASDNSVVDVSDVQLRWAVTKEHARYSVGMGSSGDIAHDISWRWSNATGDNSLWLGRPEAGILVKLRGDGNEWETPMPRGDFSYVPFVPESWGGVDAANGRFGVNVTGGGAVAFSGQRTLTSDSAVCFQFDLILTPSRPVDFHKHWSNRQIQVGYEIGYTTPQEASDMGATVVTLHQGIEGIVNGSLVNPYINYPFLPETVDFLANYTRESHALGLAVKYYYTIRELSNHAAELFALLALQGEIITDTPSAPDGGATIIPQPGYCQDWDCHGGEVWLHEHVVSNYTSCWQQALADGEWDAALCDIGTSRWFNYYVEGLKWSTLNAPHIDGIYYDGKVAP